MSYQEQRQRLINWLRIQLIGGKEQGEYLIGIRPVERYVAGVLFPLSETESIEEDLAENDNTTSARLSKRYQPPCSAGMSFYVTGKHIRLRAFYSAIRYKAGKKTKHGHIEEWIKDNLTSADGNEVVFNSPNSCSTTMHSEQILAGRGKIEALWRPCKKGFIATLSLTNTMSMSGKSKNSVNYLVEQNEKALFEIVFRCIVDQGQVQPYPSKNKALLTNEEQELELRFKDQLIYAIGHGIAVGWESNSQNDLEIFSDFLPTVEVPQVTADIGDQPNSILSFDLLSKVGDKQTILNELTVFISHYSLWLQDQTDKITHEAAEDQVTAKRIVERAKIARNRMLTGVTLLSADEKAFEAFATMNKAMLMQMSAKKTDKPDSTFKWRPFQLAFILMVLESAINDDSDFRDHVDLIWFPTGGGKTEAYLGVMAFLFVYRRLSAPASSNGTMAIMRYTLRLLTSQQFTRACKVISALELIRRRDAIRLGKTPFTIGLWVGRASSPNTFNQAIEVHQKKNFNQFVITSCPWCSKSFDARNYYISDTNFQFKCDNAKCDFGKSNDYSLPFMVVDEILYKTPPTLLIATVDKFARLAWEERASVFFCFNNNKPPELIIQDELHLISGSLGSVVGAYEVGVDALLKYKGVYPKYIASTATIRNAHKQIKLLYGREMMVFPPSGLRENDSYFAKTVPLKQKPGRLYLGYMASNLPTRKALAPLSALLLVAPKTLFNDEHLEDAWWTQLIYHGSLKGVANSQALYQSEVPSYFSRFSIENMYQELEKIEPGIMGGRMPHNFKDLTFLKGDEVEAVKRKFMTERPSRVETITSSKSAEENATVFDALNLGLQKQGAIDVALATNMVAVGLDVSRLSVIVINGQPLTTAEYIQASSRVGRGEVPGIVITNYYKSQARSLSHYENFRSYHNSFYRYVEPSSLTPFTYPVRKRALHAALITAFRHSNIGLLKNKSAMNFDKDDSKVKVLLDIIKKRIKNTIDDNVARKHITAHIDSLVSEWMDYIHEAGVSRRSLVYSSNDKSYLKLLCRFGDTDGLWQTLESMRTVEDSALIKHTRGVKL